MLSELLREYEAALEEVRGMSGGRLDRLEEQMQRST